MIRGGGGGIFDELGTFEALEFQIGDDNLSSSNANIEPMDNNVSNLDDNFCADTDVDDDRSIATKF